MIFLLDSNQNRQVMNYISEKCILPLALLNFSSLNYDAIKVLTSLQKYSRSIFH